MSELKPCPFCGGVDRDLVQAFVKATDDFAYWSVECVKCGAEIASDSSQKEADEHWNTRAALSTARYESQNDYPVSTSGVAEGEVATTARREGVEEAHRCSICGGKSFAAIDVRQFNGTYAPGPERRCIECKTMFTAQAFAKIATRPPAEDAVERAKAALLHLECFAEGEDLKRLHVIGAALAALSPTDDTK